MHSFMSKSYPKYQNIILRFGAFSKNSSYPSAFILMQHEYTIGKINCRQSVILSDSDIPFLYVLSEINLCLRQPIPIALKKRSYTK